LPNVDLKALFRFPTYPSLFGQVPISQWPTLRSDLIDVFVAGCVLMELADELGGK
jgi:hypothetical protein